MAAPGWYPDATSPGTLRWWDGTGWSDHTMSAQPAPSPAAHGAGAPPPPLTQTTPVPPVPMPRLRPDGSLKGPTFRTSMVVLLGGIALMVASAVVVVPAIVDGISGPRFTVPGSEVVQLDEGSWMIYERTDAGFGRGAIRPGNVSVEGAGRIDIRSQLGGLTETITRGSAEYTGAVRFEVESAGEYRITVMETSPGEALVARPVTALFSRWPWFLAFAVGSVAALAGVVMWIVGASNRRTARRAVAAAGFSVGRVRQQEDMAGG